MCSSDLFRAAAIVALLLAASADLVGRRRLLLITIFGQGVFTLATAFAPDYRSFVLVQILTRVFGYAEEMLCLVVIAEEVAAGARGWAGGTITSFYFLGAGVASALFGAVSLLPHGWRALYFLGAISILMVGFLRQRLPETQRFQSRGETGPKLQAALGLLRDLVREYPGRICAAITALMTGMSYATSAEMAGERGAFAGFEDNRAHMLRVIRNHARAAGALPGAYEGLHVDPVAMDADNCPDKVLVDAARESWKIGRAHV